MVAGLNMLSFDLFGLGRRKDTDSSSSKAQLNEPEQKSPSRDERSEERQDQPIFFWALSPVI